MQKHIASFFVFCSAEIYHMQPPHAFPGP